VRLLKYNLAVEIAPEYRRQVPPDVKEIAIKAKEGIQDTNDKNVPILTSDLVPWPRDLGNAWFSGGAADDGTAGEVIITQTGTAGAVITQTGSAAVIIVQP